MAMSTTLVGVAVFSETRNRRVRMENVQMSMPLFRGKEGGEQKRRNAGQGEYKKYAHEAEDERSGEGRDGTSSAGQNTSGERQGKAFGLDHPLRLKAVRVL